MKIKVREILFRGKDVNTGEWVYGNFVKDAVEQERGLKCGVDGFIRNYDTEKEHVVMYEVERETVGEYTGLTDKRGDKIFEGDIISYQIDNDDCPFPNKDTKKRIGRVFFQDFRASFAVAEGRNGSDMLNQDLYKYVRGGNRTKVIGNVFDNPELLKNI